MFSDGIGLLSDQEFPEQKKKKITYEGRRMRLSLGFFSSATLDIQCKILFQVGRELGIELHL